jgi:hypothetical protein
MFPTTREVLHRHGGHSGIGFEVSRVLAARGALGSPLRRGTANREGAPRLARVGCKPSDGSRQPRSQLLRLRMRLLLFVVTVLVALGLLLQWLNGIGGWRAHVLALIGGIIVALAMTFLPEYFAPLHALIDRLDRPQTHNWGTGSN